jgi:hypothetical protein
VVVETLLNNGKVYAVKKDNMPEAYAATAAILRY